jgi:hypothetical protein
MEPLLTQEVLEAWLRAAGIDTLGWGMGGAKTVADLWTELQEGDVLLDETLPLRLVNVVQVCIRRDGRELFEMAQELADGQQRRRNRLPSEKVKVGESYLAAAARCLREELGLNADEFNVGSELLDEKVRTVDSPSYPGLATRYRLVTVAATAVGLPDTPFWRDNAAAAQGDPVLRHLWAWRQVD